MIDDFVFMCVLVGNDFLPNVPHLDIADGALNHMMNMYKVRTIYSFLDRYSPEPA